MTTIETNGRTLVVVGLLDGANGFAICNWVNGYTVLDYQYEDGDLEYQILSTSKQEYKIIGLLSELSRDIKIDTTHFSKNELIELRYLLKCNGIDTNKPLLIIEKIK